MIDSDQKNEYIFGEKNNYHQVESSYLQNEKDVPISANRALVDRKVIRLIKNAFAYCLKDARLSTTGGSVIEHNKFLGQVSTIMGVLTSKEGDLSSHCDKINESQAEINNTTLKHLPLKNHDIAGNIVK